MIVQCMTTIVQHNLTIVDNCGAQLAVADKKGALFLSFSRTAWRMVGKGEYIGSIAQKITGSNIATAYIAAHFERRRVYCRPEQETRRPAGANTGPGAIKEAAFHL